MPTTQAKAPKTSGEADKSPPKAPKPKPPQVISVSYKTDIPTFYGEWFMNRVREGYALYRNPHWQSDKDVLVSLKPEDVVAFAFWSKNYHPFLKHLDELIERGYGCIFHYTINGLPKQIETRVRNYEQSADTLCKIAEKFSPDHVFWRFDPILFSNITPDEEYFQAFEKIATRVKGHTRRCFIKFLNIRTGRGTDPVKAIQGIQIDETPSFARKRTFITTLADIAAANDIGIYACREDGLFDEPPMDKQTFSRLPNKPFHPNLFIGSCIGQDVLMQLYPDRMPASMKRCGLDKEKGCYCVDHRDIGEFHTCPHGCLYCYAVKDHQHAREYAKSHDPMHDNMTQDRPKQPPPQEVPKTQDSTQPPPPQSGQAEFRF